MARKGGRSGRKLAEWLIVEVARNTGEDYIIRPPMDAMKAHTDSKKFWEAVVWNGQHNEAQFRLAMAGATGLTDVFVESLPFLSDFVRDQSQEVLEQLIKQKVAVTRFEVVTPSLNDVFIRIAGENY